MAWNIAGEILKLPWLWKNHRLSDYHPLLKDAQQDNSWLNDVFAFLHKSNAVFLNSSFFIFGKFSLAPTEAWQPPIWSYACLIDPRDIYQNVHHFTVHWRVAVSIPFSCHSCWAIMTIFTWLIL